MPLTNYTGGIQAPNIGGAGTVAGKVFYVGNRSGLPSSNGADPQHPFATLNAALAKCQANRGDVVRILPGHVETISSADQMSNLVAGVTIEGIVTGGKNLPVLRWTAAAATFLLDVAGVTLRNLWLQMAGDPSGSTALTVAAPITVSAARCAIEGCLIQVGVDADQLVTDAITTTAAADDFVVNDCEIYGAAAAEVTTVLKLVGADRLRLTRCKITAASATDTAGIVVFATTASTDILISDVVIHANGAGNKTCIDMSAALANTGTIDYVLCRNMTDANTEWILTTGAGCDVQLGNNVYGVNNSNERGKQIGTASV